MEEGLTDQIVVSKPTSTEELRQLAQAMADIHYVLSIIVQHRTMFVPGESAAELKAAWDISEKSLRALVTELDPPPNDPSPLPPLFDKLAKAELTGEVGHLKRATLHRLKDSCLSYWFSEPQTDEKRAKAAGAVLPYLDFGASVVSSIPGYEHVIECLSLVQKLIELRLRRGY